MKKYDAKSYRGKIVEKRKTICALYGTFIGYLEDMDNCLASHVELYDMFEFEELHKDIIYLKKTFKSIHSSLYEDINR